MNSRGEQLDVWLPAGALGALALSVALIPLRSVTSASNLAFAFLPWTILVAELGGRNAALATALVSAMSLDFFLTEPYLALTISKTEDVIAFVALAVCGVIVAAFAGRRERSTTAAARARSYQEALAKLVAHLDRRNPLSAALEDLRSAFGLSRIVLRDVDGRVRAASPSEAASSPPARVILERETLAPGDDSNQRLGKEGFRLPEGGGQLPLPIGNTRMTLELWEGSPDGLSLEARRALSLAAALIRRELNSSSAADGVSRLRPSRDPR